ncbi:MAG: hypothetical protein J6D37_05000 [Clostridia bacterium]|nr:hypothetical protein [Clostridia bacterium]
MKSFAIYKFHGKFRKKRTAYHAQSPSPPHLPPSSPPSENAEKFDYFSDFVKRHETRARRIERENKKK